MSLEDLRGILGNEAFASQKALSRYAPTPQGEDSPLDELDREMLKHQQAAPTVRDVPEGESRETSDAASPLDDLDREFEERASTPERRIGKQFLQGALASPAELIGGAKDIYSAGKEVVTQKPQEYGTGAKLAKKYGVPTEPERATWYERLARAEGTGAPITALGTYLGGPVGGAATALGIGASALAEPYIAGLADKLPWHLGPAAQIAAGALLGRKVGKVAGGVLTKKPITPTVKDFENSAHGNYDKVDNSGITLEPNIAANETANKTLTTLGPGADINSPGTVALVNKLQPAPNGAPTDIRQVTAIYKALGQIEPVGPKMKGYADYRAANIARDHIKDYLDNIPNSAPYSVVSGHANIPEMYKNWTDANADWAAARRVDTINKRFEAGMAQAGTTYSGGNAFNAIRQKFRPLVDPLRFNRQFNKEEQDYIKQHFVHGTMGQNALRLASRLAPDNAFGMWGNVYAGANALAGSPAYLGITAASLGSLAARQAAKAAQKANLREFRTMTASRSPLFRKLNPGFVKSEHEIGPGTAGGAGGALESLEEAVPEYIHQGLDISKEAGGVEGDEEKKKKEEGGGYSDNGIGDRLLKAMGRLPGPSGSVGGYGKKHGGTATGDFDLGRASRMIGGYDQPTERFADPEALHLTMARKAAMPRSGIADVYALQNPLEQMQMNPQPQTAVGGGMLPMAQTAIGGGITPTPRMGIGGYAGNYGAGHVGGYDDGVTGMLHKMAAPIVAEHSQPWNMGRLLNVGQQALGMVGGQGPAAEAMSMPASIGGAMLPGNRSLGGQNRTYSGGGYDGGLLGGPYSALMSGSAANTTQPTPADIINTNMALNRADPNFRFGRDYAQNPDIRQLSRDLGTAMAPIEAYHGSPYDFEKFSSEKIGTGEGAQAYGHGLYFADKPGVAESYKKQLAQHDITISDELEPNRIRKLNQSSFEQGTPEDIARAHLTMAADSGAKDPISLAKAKLGDSVANNAYPEWTPRWQDALKVIGKWEKQGLQVKPNPGHMYQVEIGSEPEHFLDWDKPLSEQSEAMRRAVHNAGGGIPKNIMYGEMRDKYSAPIDAVLKGTQAGRFVTGENVLGGNVNWDALKESLPEEQFRKIADIKDAFDKAPSLYENKEWNHTGAQVYAHMNKTTVEPPQGFGISHTDNEKQVSEALHKAGIQGIRYLDQGSRNWGQRKIVPAATQSDAETMAQKWSDAGFGNVGTYNENGKWYVQGYPSNVSHNYVVFDPSIIRIMRKYGILGPAAVAGSALSQQDRSPEVSSFGMRPFSFPTGGYRKRRRGGYGMGQVSPLAGGSAY